MTRKQRRLYFVLLGLLALGAAATLVLTAISDSLVYFYTPSDLVSKPQPEGRRMRIGGLVQDHSVIRDGKSVTFVVTDLVHTLPVTYAGILPDLFREGQGVVVEGKMGGDGTFLAAEVLAKHDEKYMPKDVADALKKSGQWKEDPQAK
ncbi:cytochrome c maturation protein CcmE [Magnetospirillum fulvum]|jgi:cytochrome c-type biogenesis protein CcmE|uniref:Cytochrome c-type biogenesis protein CcmE n=1 Tax=Magnetospirillum fulvum MGU-K5 TaxID=1316936 RepID=S9TUW9_MAGFU|nr:cytochrome c maturation protein CcmE [Magnetospirillum fulvum]EPY02265.1 cytochrome c-type biogenesis protein CcmE [Magnetospirillum fulvum MGU-K5]